jgi:CheY-like chemotaxis protein
MVRSYLLVDDNVAFAENVAEILRDGGDEVAIADSGEAALGLVRQTRFDALITDMRMPRMGGAQLLRQLRTLDPGIPVVMVTAYSGDEDLAIARSEGLLAVLAKPPRLDRLAELLRAARRDGLVALIEDDEALSDNLSELLRARGLTAVQATSVLETERLGAVRPFAAVVDLRVPGGPDGEAMRRLLQRFPGLPSLIITAHLDVPPPAGHAGYFKKPFDPVLLLEAVEKLYRPPTERA